MQTFSRATWPFSSERGNEVLTNSPSVHVSVFQPSMTMESGVIGSMLGTGLTKIINPAKCVYPPMETKCTFTRRELEAWQARATDKSGVPLQAFNGAVVNLILKREDRALAFEASSVQIF
jgi:hypothetical protein